MNCLQIDECLFDYCDGQLPFELKQEIELHLQQCPTCQAKVDLTQLETKAIVDGIGIPTLPTNFTEQVMALVTSSVIPESVSFIARLRQKSRLWFAGLAVAGATAVLMVTLVLPRSADYFQVADNNEDIKPKSSMKSIVDNSKVKSPNISPDSSIIAEDIKTGNFNNKEITRSQDEIREIADAEITVKSSDKLMTNESQDTLNQNQYPAVRKEAESARAYSLKLPQTCNSNVNVKIHNLPVQYKLVSSYPGENQAAVFVYSDTEQNSELIIEVEQIPKKTLEYPGAGNNASAADNNDLLQLNKIATEITSGEYCYIVTMTGSLPPQNLTEIASNLEITRDEN